MYVAVSICNYTLFSSIDLDPPPSNGLRILQHSPEQLATDFLSQPSKFVSLLHTNYMCHFQDIENVLIAADLMSRSDIYMNEWRVSLIRIFPFILLNLQKLGRVYVRNWSYVGYSWCDGW